MFNIRKAVVIGSGVMGSGIAGHLANAGIKVVLLDIVPNKLTDEEQKKGLSLNDKQVRNRIVMAAQKRMADKRSSSMFFYIPGNIDLINFGNIEDDLEQLRDADWIIEAVVENIDIKRGLFTKIAPYLSDRVLLSTNTSGISVNDLSEVVPENLKSKFFVSHFFNPVRFMKLLELIPCKYTDRKVMEYMTEFCEDKLGKGVVVAKDTPGFIANRFGTYSFMQVVQQATKYKMSIEEVDALTGKEIGRPNTGTYKLFDLVGLDTLYNLINYLKDNSSTADEKTVLTLPEYFGKMVEKGYLGDKTKQGFYKKSKPETLLLDLNSLEYRPKQAVSSQSLEQSKKCRFLKDKLNILINGSDQSAKFVWDVLKNTLLFAASMIPEVADDIESIDNSMKWGYNWEVGPFELWDLIGVKASVTRMKAEGAPIPAIIENLLASGRESFYEGKGAQAGNIKKITPQILKEQSQAILQSDAGTLVDMDDGVACFVLHSKNNTVYPEVIELVYKSLDEVKRNFIGMVFASAGSNFCVGGNLGYMLEQAQNKNWPVLEKMGRDFQNLNMMLKYFNQPIVAAPFGMTLGGGTEIVLHCTKTRATAELNMGLVEVGVGLIPAGGGTKEIMIKLTEEYSANKSIELLPFVTKAHDLVSSAKVSMSAADAKALGYLSKTDSVAMNKDYQLFKAKKDVIELADTFTPKIPGRKYRVGGDDMGTMLKHSNWNKFRGGFISEYDNYLMDKVAYVMTGGKIGSMMTQVTEQYLLDLEVEVFMSLAGEERSRARMAHMLKTGKALRN